MLRRLACDVCGAFPVGGLASPWKFCLLRVAMASNSTQLLHHFQAGGYCRAPLAHACGRLRPPAVAVLTALRPYLQLPFLQGQEFALLYTGTKGSYTRLDGNFQPDMCAEGRATLRHWVLMPQNDRRMYCSKAPLCTTTMLTVTLEREARIRGLFLKHKKTGNPLVRYPSAQPEGCSIDPSMCIKFRWTASLSIPRQATRLMRPGLSTMLFECRDV